MFGKTVLKKKILTLFNSTWETLKKRKFNRGANNSVFICLHPRFEMLEYLGDI